MVLSGSMHVHTHTPTHTHTHTHTFAFAPKALITLLHYSHESLLRDSSCGIVVCSVCSPSGERIPGDGTFACTVFILSPSLSLSLTHTHTHSHTLSLSLPLSLFLSVSLSVSLSLSHTLSLFVTGINRSSKLKDYRMPLPHLGDLGLRRVCLHCYLDN